MAQKQRQRLPVDLSGKRRMLAEGFQFRGEQEAIAAPAIVQRLDSDRIPGQGQATGLPIPDGQCEHAVQVSQCIGHAPLGDRFQQYLGVRVTAKAVSQRLESLPQRAKIVEFPVVDKDVPPHADSMGWCPRGDRSNMDRRRCPKASSPDSFIQYPTSSGPRCASRAVIRARVARRSSRSRSANSMKPVIPHIVALPHAHPGRTFPTRGLSIAASLSYHASGKPRVARQKLRPPVGHSESPFFHRLEEKECICAGEDPSAVCRGLDGRRWK
jgi:hypothetical protein